MNVLFAMILIASPSEAIAEQIAASLPPELGLVSVVLPRALENAKPPFAIAWKSAPKAGTVTLQLHAQDRKGWITAKLGRVSDVAVAANDLAPGDTITEDDLILERRAVPKSASQLAREFLVGRVVAQPVKKGEPIAKQQLVGSAPVARGSEVTILVRSGDVEVAAAGRLERPAEIGARAVVRMHGANKPKTGVLVDRDTVLIEENKR